MEFESMLRATAIDTDSIQFTLNDVDDAINQIFHIFANMSVMSYNVYVLYDALISKIYSVCDHINTFISDRESLGRIIDHAIYIVTTLEHDLRKITIIVMHADTVDTLSEEDRVFTQSMRNICKIDDDISTDAVDDHLYNIVYVRSMVLRIINDMTYINGVTYTTYMSLLDNMIDSCDKILQFIERQPANDVYTKLLPDAQHARQTINDMSVKLYGKTLHVDS